MSHATAGRHSSGSRVNRTNARPKEICRRVAQPCLQGLCPSETRAFPARDSAPIACGTKQKRQRPSSPRPCGSWIRQPLALLYGATNETKTGRAMVRPFVYRSSRTGLCTRRANPRHTKKRLICWIRGVDSRRRGRYAASRETAGFILRSLRRLVSITEAAIRLQPIRKSRP